ncbi:MAG: LytTR family transcriptional regulator [Lachnospiraceae bacterium]|nr:LytTR family transcriptional regulator [Lachnospiraceae bacterium]
MKVTIVEPEPNEEEEVIIKCRLLDEELMRLINHFKQGGENLTVYREGEVFFLKPDEVFYFESVDQKVFAYCRSEVYQVKRKLYELLEDLPAQDFVRVSKSSILNLNQIKSLAPAFGGRYEARLKNGEKVIISRQYVGPLKEKLGV